MKKLLSIALITIMLTGCATTRIEAPSVTYKGTINQVYRYQVEQKPNKEGGALLGGLAGGIIGSQMGKGHGNLAMTFIGSIIGASVGENIASQPVLVPMSSVTIRFDDGASYRYEVKDMNWKNGQRVVMTFRGQEFRIDPIQR